MSGYDSAVLADTPWGYWECNETSGGSLADASGNGRSMAITGSPTLGQAGPVSGETAILWPAVDNTYATTSATTTTSAATLEAWVYLTAIPSAATAIVACATAPGSATEDKALYVDIDGTIKFQTYSGGTSETISSSAALSLNAWHHVVASVGAAATKIRIDKTTVGTGVKTASYTGAQQVFVHGGGQISTQLDASKAITIAKPAFYAAQLTDSRTDAHYDAMYASSPRTGTLTANTRSATAAISGTYGAPTFTGTLAAKTPHLRASFAGSTGSVDHSGTLAATAPRVTARMSGTFVGAVTTTVTGNLLNGRERDGMAMVTVDPAQAAPPNTLAIYYGVDKAIALPAPTMVNGRPTGAYAQARGVYTAAGRDRVLIGGTDITFFRSTDADPKMLTVPGYTLSEPFAYDSCTLTVPQVNPLFENLGTGSLRWARKGSSVEFQRVYADGTKVTDYRGVVLAVRSSGGALTLDIGGEVSGRAQLLNAQPPLFWKTADVGWLAWEALAHIGVTMTPRGGPNTGIRIPRAGGMSWLAWMQQVCAMSQTSAGQQRTMMPKTWGGQEWSFATKDTTTVDFTIFLDGARAAEDLVDDASEQPNVWYGTGVTPDGVRVRNGRYPRLMPGAAPAYGDVRALQFALVWANYLDDDTYTPGTYDDATTAAVRRLQRDVGLPVTGNLDKATWNALFNLSATGYSLEGSRIFPMIEDDKVRPYNYTANGAVIGRNPKFDRRVLRVERNVDFGSGVTKPRMIDWCEGQDERLSGTNWAGTITLNGVGVFRGKWNQGDTPPASAVMSMRDVRPGMNGWLPAFDGGTLVHVGGATYNPGSPGSVTLAVDTQARDLMELAQIIERNRQSRRNIRREWNHENRGNGPNHNQITFDEYGGRLSRDLSLQGNQWNVFPLVAGQTGTIERVDIRLKNAEAEFCMAIFSRELTVKHLQGRIGNPFPVNKDGETVWETQGLQDWFDDKTILYAAGSNSQPCGYWPRRKYGDKTDSNGNPVQTSAPITGRWRDDAGAPYKTPSDTAPVVWVAIYPDRDCVLQSGRLLYKLEDDAV